MFSTLESNWDHSAHRGRATLASFAIQVFGLSMLIAVSMLWVERPPQVHWLQPLPTPEAITPPRAEQPAPGHHAANATGSPRPVTIIAPPSIPDHIVVITDADSGPPAPELPNHYTGPQGPGGGIRDGLGALSVVIPARPIATKPLQVSDLGEGSIIHRVQPVYPPLARQARIQGSVELRAVISKAGTIENLAVVSGHPMLVKAAMEAVRQWRYRPYLLNHEPIEVETDITVNFLLSGG